MFCYLYNCNGFFIKNILDFSTIYSTIYIMGKTGKTIIKMRNTPRDWQIADLEIIAGHFGIIVRKGKGSHVSFSHPEWVHILTIPAHRPVKPIYIKKFVSLIDALKEGEI